MSLLFVVNSVIEWTSLGDDGVSYSERVLWIDQAGDYVAVINISNHSELPVIKTKQELEEALNDGLAIKRTVDPYAFLSMPDSGFLNKHKPRMEKAWRIIQALVDDEPDIYFPEKRGPLVRAVAEKFSVTSKEIYKYLKRYWKSGKIKYALLPEYKNCGAPGRERSIEGANSQRPKRGRPPALLAVDPEHIGVNVDEDIKKIFEVAYRLYYLTPQKNTLKRAYEMMIEKYFNCGFETKDGTSIPIIPPQSELPTFGQFRYWSEKKMSISQTLIKREGLRKYNLTRREILGTSTQMAFGPGSIFQIDATIADVYLVSSLNRNWIIGRPVIYFVVDVFSRMVVGLYVGLEGPSWLSGMMAMAQATTDKVSFCSKYDIEISAEIWPCTYLPVSVLGDNGEFKSINSDNLPSELGVTLANCPSYRADWKGIVEQMFNRANEKVIHWVPGAVRKVERGDRDYRLDATLDLHQFTKLIIYNLLDYNMNHRISDYPMEIDMISDDVEPIPLELWNWGIVNRSGHLREKSSEIIKLNLMPKETAVVTAKGLRFKGLYYSTDRAMREDWYVRARKNGTWSVPVSYDPRCLEVIYIRIAGKDVLEPCNLLSSAERFGPYMMEEVEDYFAVKALKSKQYEGRRLQSSAELRAQQERIQSEAKKMKKEVFDQSLSNNQRTQGIRSHHADEKQRNKTVEKFDLRPPKDPANPGTIHSIHSEEDTEHHVTTEAKKKQVLSMLKGQSEGD